MKKLFLLPLMMFALVGCNQPAGGGAKEIVFTAEDFNSASQTDFSLASAEKEGLKVAFTKLKYAPAGQSQAGESYPSQIRSTKSADATMTLSGKTVTKVVFACQNDSRYGADGFVASAGTIGENAADQENNTLNATWTGESSELVFTSSGHQVRIIKFTVTVK